MAEQDIPHFALASVRNLIAHEADPRQQFKLKVVFQDTDVNVRDFAAFLKLIDRLYATFYGGSRKYGARVSDQLEIERFNSGSVDISWFKTFPI